MFCNFTGHFLKPRSPPLSAPHRKDHLPEPNLRWDTCNLNWDPSYREAQSNRSSTTPTYPAWHECHRGGRKDPSLRPGMEVASNSNYVCWIPPWQQTVQLLSGTQVNVMWLHNLLTPCCAKLTWDQWIRRKTVLALYVVCMFFYSPLQMAYIDLARHLDPFFGIIHSTV